VVRTAALLFCLSAPAHAVVPPAFTGAPISFNFSTTSEAIINLRQQGVIRGTAPLRVSVGQVLVDGSPSQQSVFASGYPNDNSGTCIAINTQTAVFSASAITPSSIQVQLTVSNGADVAPVTALVTIASQTGPVVNPEDSAATAACLDANQTPVANAGPSRSVADSDGKPGENVTLDGSGSTDGDGAIANYQWTLVDTGRVLGTGTSPTLVTALPDGANVVRLTVTDDSGDTETGVASRDVTITVAAAIPATLTANAGPDQNVKDTDGQPGESVTLNGSASATTNPQIPISQYTWRAGENQLGTGPTLVTRLPDGTTVVQLTVTDSAGRSATDSVQIVVGGKPVPDKLADLPNLTEKQHAMAVGIDGACSRIYARADSENPLSTNQQDLLARCNGLLVGNTEANQVEALDALAPDDFAVARTQTLLFANTQYAGVMDRLIALRGGAKGLSLAGLNIVVDGKLVSVAQLQKMAEQVLGGGASADDEPGGLLSDKWGLWARGNYSFGNKRADGSAPSFDADQWALVGGIDYRLTDKSVIGASLAYGDAKVKFDPSGEGALDTTSWALSLYGSMYAAKNFYLDGIVNAANSDYDASRNITYVDGSGLVQADATGKTDGITLSGGLSAGYDFPLGGVTLSPNVGFFYIDSTIDGFTEQGAAGLDLIYDKQKFKSLTGNLGIRMTYAWNLSWGALLPQIRADYVREFENGTDVFGVRFAADPNANSTPPILVQTDNPDDSYWRLAAGFSAQFKYGISGYVEYQRLEGFQLLNFQDVSVGLRLQHSF
jgi:outer membrane autotransporter protein